LAARSTLRDHAAHRVTRTTRCFGARVGGVAILDHSPLDLEAAGAQLGGGGPLIVAQISNDCARRRGIELHVVERDHAPHGHLPTFRRFSLVRDALQHPGRVTLMTTLTIRARRGVADNEPSRRVTSRGSTAAARTTSATSGAATAAT